nr:hypothetical protein [Tanacetum cinerariifolium]
MNQQMNEAVRLAVQIQTDRLCDSYQRENDEFLRTIDDNMKRIVKEQVKSQVKEQVSKILPRIEQSVNAQLEDEVLTRSSHSSRTSYAIAADLSEMELKKILIKKMEGNKSIQCSDKQRNLYKALVEAYEADTIILDTYRERVILKRRRDDDDDQGEGPSVGSDQGSKRQREGEEPESASAPLESVTRSAGRSTTGSKSRQASASESAFVEEPVQTTFQIEEPSHLVFETGTEDQPIVQSSQHTEWFSQLKKPSTPDHTPLDFSNFIMNRLRVDTLTPKLLAGPTYELIKGSCNSLTELEYHLEEVYKATTDQLDWVNPEGQQYPHNLLQPLSLIPNNRGRRVIPFAHFINNDLEYLRGGTSSRKYTTSVKKTKAADYGHIEWIEDLVPRTMWIQEPINYDKHDLWGVSYWGRKRQQFYGFAINWESALDVYSKRRIIATQEDHSNKIRALNVDSLKVDSVVIQNPCLETEDSNSETTSCKSVKESSLDSATKDVHAIKYKMSKAKERCMTYFRSLHSHLQVLSKEDLKGTRIEHGFIRAFISLFCQEADTFTSTMLLNVDLLQKQLDKDEFYY